MNKIAIKLKPAAERKVKIGHPWVFEDSIVKQSRVGETGDLCIVFDNTKNQFLAMGLFDEDSPIKVKLFQFHKQTKFDDNFILNNLKKAYQKREKYFNDNFNAYRLVYGESDNFPSLIIDIYNKSAVIKIYSLIWVDFLKLISEYIYNLLDLDCVILRLSRNIEIKAKQIDLFNGKILQGELNNNNIIFKENGLFFNANIVSGHKTGYFLDQRANRRSIGEIAKSKSVLDVFSYNGGFTINALCKGAKSVTSIDINEHALKSIEDNLKLNKYNGKFNFICGDAFVKMEELIKSKAIFDIVVIDPPAFAKSEREIETAKKQYLRLANLGTKLVNKGGYLVLASCSSRVSSQEFFDINKNALKNIKYELIEKSFHDFDHLADLDEMKYLKCGFYKFI